MKKYVCSICGYVYDEEKGIPEKGIKPGTKWEDLPDDFKCPWCGAPKNMFKEKEEEKEKTEKIEEHKEELEEKSDTIKEDLRELSNSEIYYLCTSLAKGCEKQYLEEEKNLFFELSEFYKEKENVKEGSLRDIEKLMEEDNVKLTKAMDISDKFNDRGAKRVITWASKTTNIVKTIIEEYNTKGIEYLKNNKIWVCDICGFVYVGEKPPKICPICKVPNIKILEVE